MSERATDFVRRIGSELKDFTSQKSRELVDKVQEGADRVVSATEERTYQTALSLVAKRHNLTTEEADSRLRTIRRTKTKSTNS